LGQVDREFTDGLRDCQRHDIVVSHASFGYLADRYGLRQIPITGLSPEVEPTPQHLAAAADEARRVGATTVFFETLVSPRVAQVVASAIGAQTAVLDPIEGLEPGAGGDYVSVMRENLATLRPALGCT
jgi:zinc transport system substrate-binding protein